VESGEQWELLRLVREVVGGGSCCASVGEAASSGSMATAACRVASGVNCKKWLTAAAAALTTVMRSSRGSWQYGQGVGFVAPAPREMELTLVNKCGNQISVSAGSGQYQLDQDVLPERAAPGTGSSKGSSSRSAEIQGGSRPEMAAAAQLYGRRLGGADMWLPPPASASCR
jgi:hypothetical protein